MKPSHLHKPADKYAVWALTPKGGALAATLAGKLRPSDLYLTKKPDTPAGAIPFSRLSETLARVFHQYKGHLFIMSAGIVVRVIAPLIRHKSVDPAVVVMDEAGRHAVSLLSGHVGGANALAEKAAALIGATAVITTATDVNQVPAVDVLARERGLFIENPAAVKAVSMALLSRAPILFHDPFDCLADAFSPVDRLPFPDGKIPKESRDLSGVFIDDRLRLDLPPGILILRPQTLVAGMGCNRNTPLAELHTFLLEVLAKFHLSPRSLARIATVTLKKDEPGLRALAETLDRPLAFFTKEALRRIDTIKTPSEMVEKHIGVKSVCEAAAILAADHGPLIVPKHRNRNVTVALARISSTSSASDQAV